MAKRKSNLDYFLDLAEAKEERRHLALSIAGSKGWTRMWQLRRERATARRKARRKRDGSMLDRRSHAMKWAIPGWQVLLTRCDPEHWYEFGEIRALMPECTRDCVKAYFYQKCRGRFERALHPDYTPQESVYRQKLGMYVYKISLQATQEAAGWRKALWEYDDTGI